MTDHAVTPLRAAPAPAYSDTDALNDIHAIVTTPSLSLTALAEVAEAVTRTGRPLAAVRDIEVHTTETELGWPVACTHAGDTTVAVRQDPTGPGLLVEITTETAAEAAALTLVLDGTTVHPAAQPGPTPA